MGIAIALKGTRTGHFNAHRFGNLEEFVDIRRVTRLGIVPNVQEEPKDRFTRRGKTLVHVEYIGG